MTQDNKGPRYSHILSFAVDDMTHAELISKAKKRDIPVSELLRQCVKMGLICMTHKATTY